MFFLDAFLSFWCFIWNFFIFIFPKHSNKLMRWCFFPLAWLIYRSFLEFVDIRLRVPFAQEPHARHERLYQLWFFFEFDFFNLWIHGGLYICLFDLCILQEYSGFEMQASCHIHSENKYTYRKQNAKHISNNYCSSTSSRIFFDIITRGLRAARDLSASSLAVGLIE